MDQVSCIRAADWVYLFSPSRNRPPIAYSEYLKSWHPNSLLRITNGSRLSAELTSFTQYPLYSQIRHYPQEIVIFVAGDVLPCSRLPSSFFVPF